MQPPTLVSICLQPFVSIHLRPTVSICVQSLTSVPRLYLLSSSRSSANYSSQLESLLSIYPPLFRRFNPPPIRSSNLLPTRGLSQPTISRLSRFQSLVIIGLLHFDFWKSLASIPRLDLPQSLVLIGLQSRVLIPLGGRRNETTD